MTDQPDETTQYLESRVRRLPAAPAEIVPYASKDVVAAPSGVSRAGGGFLGSLTKFGAGITLIAVLISGVAHGEFTPFGMLGAAYGDLQTAFRKNSQDADAEALRKQKDAEVDARLRAEANEPWAKTVGVAKAVCGGGMRVTGEMSNGNPWADFARGLTGFACAVAGNGGY